jgi:hypothetical protein
VALTLSLLGVIVAKNIRKIDKERIMSVIQKIEITLLVNEDEKNEILKFFHKCESRRISNKSGMYYPVWLEQFDFYPLPMKYIKGRCTTWVNIAINYTFMDPSTLRVSEQSKSRLHFPENFLKTENWSEKVAKICRKEYEEFKNLIGI